MSVILVSPGSLGGMNLGGSLGGMNVVGNSPHGEGDISCLVNEYIMV